MVQVIDRLEDAGGAEYIHFRPYRSPRDPNRILANWRHAVDEHGAASIGHHVLGTPVELDFKRAYIRRPQARFAGPGRGSSARVAPVPDGADRLEAALARRLDRMSRHFERIERHVDISNEALAVFVRFWLTSTPALPDPSASTRAWILVLNPPLLRPIA